MIPDSWKKHTGCCTFKLQVEVDPVLLFLSILTPWPKENHAESLFFQFWFKLLSYNSVWYIETLLQRKTTRSVVAEQSCQNLKTEDCNAGVQRRDSEVFYNYQECCFNQAKPRLVHVWKPAENKRCLENVAATVKQLDLNRRGGWIKLKAYIDFDNNLQDKLISFQWNAGDFSFVVLHMQVSFRMTCSGCNSDVGIVENHNVNRPTQEGSG